MLKLFWGIFLEKNFAQCTLEGRNLGKFEKKIDKNLKFQKCPKTVLKVSKQILNLFWGNFLGKNCPVHPGRSKLGKTSKNWKTFNFQNAQIRSQKCSILFSTCFEVFFPVKKFAQCTLKGREIEKFQKKWKKFNFQNPEKRFQKCPNFFWGDFFRTFLDQCNLEIKTCRNSKKKSKKIEFLKVSKNVLKSFSNKCWNCFEVFFWKKILPSARWRVETWKKVRKMEKLSFFFKKPKYISKKVQKRFEHASR